jgi:hypothetical protein
MALSVEAGRPTMSVLTKHLNMRMASMVLVADFVSKLHKSMWVKQELSHF